MNWSVSRLNTKAHALLYKSRDHLPQGKLLIEQGLQMLESELLQAKLDQPVHFARIYCHALAWALLKRPKSSGKCLWLWVLWNKETKVWFISFI